MSKAVRMARRKKSTRELPDSQDVKLTELIEGRGKAGDTKWVPFSSSADAQPDTAELIADSEAMAKGRPTEMRSRPRPTAGQRPAPQTNEVLEPGRRKRASARTTVLTPEVPQPETEPRPKPRRSGITGWVSSRTELVRLSPMANGLVVLLLLTTMLVAFGAVLLNP
ncbi:MAG: hypothetical protein AAGA48_08855 [Myxococcota bacterium]